MAGPLRLFVAAEIPDDRLRAIERATQPLRGSVAGARWASVENQHVTVKFLGRTPEDSFDDVLAAATSAAGACPRGTLRLTGLGAFPSLRRARVLWVGLDDPADVLGCAARALDRALEPLGFEREKRAFTAHLTLARLKVPGPVGDAFDRIEIPPLDEFPVDRLVLFRSHLSPKGARYEALAELPLR